MASFTFTVRLLVVQRLWDIPKVGGGQKSHGCLGYKAFRFVKSRIPGCHWCSNALCNTWVHWRTFSHGRSTQCCHQVTASEVGVFRGNPPPLPKPLARTKTSGGGLKAGTTIFGLFLTDDWPGRAGQFGKIICIFGDKQTFEGQVWEKTGS